MQLLNLFFEQNIVQEIFRHEQCAGYVNEYLSSDFLKAFVKPYSDIRSQRKIFSGIGDKNPTEIVATVNRASLRETVVDSVRQKVLQNRLPYIHLSYYPRGYRTICAFRVDCDVSDKSSFFNLLQHAENYDFPVTWFIDVGSQESYLKDVAAISKEGHDVQLHCYDHFTYDNYRENERNIRKGRDLMEAAGIPVTGFVSPFGQWNPALNKVLEDMKFTYSSEFAISYDDLPFYPVFNRHISRVLQIPIHPICIGSLRKACCTPEEMMVYYEMIIQRKYDRRSPILLYGHPKNEIDWYPETIDFIFSRLNGLQDVWITTFTEYAAWWEKRLKTEFKVSIENDSLRIVTNNTDDSLELHIERPDATETWLPLANGTKSLSQLSWSVKETTFPMPSDEIGIIPSPEPENIAGRIVSVIRNL